MLLTLTCLPQGNEAPYTAFLEPLDGLADWSMLGGERGQILGAHLWAERRPWGWLCALRVSNGAANPDATGFCGGVHYRELTLSCGDTWKIVPELQRGPSAQMGTQRLDLALSGNHFFPRCAQFVRRFALVSSRANNAIEAREALDMLDLSIPDPVLSYGPAKSRLPKVDRVAMGFRFGPKVSALRTALHFGVANEPQRLLSNLMGPFQPYGREGWEYGGNDIELATGFGQCASSILWDRMRMDLTIERMAIAAFDKQTGERLSIDTWLKPFHMDLDGDEERIDIYADNKRPALPPAFDKPDWNPGVCAYRPVLEGFYDSHNGEHSIRASAFAKSPAELAGDPVARAYLVELCQHQRQSLSEKTVLPALIKIAKGPPANVGRISLGRSHGESSDIAAWAIHLKPRDAGLRKYGGMLDDLLQATAPAHGIAQRATSGGWDMTAMWQGGFGALPSEDGAQAFEAAFVIMGAIELKTVLGRYGFWSSLFFKEPAEIRAARSLYRGSLPRVVGEYNPAVRSIPHYIVVGLKGGAPVATITKGYSKGDISHVHHVLALVADVTKDVGWLTASLVFDIPVATLAARLKALQVDDQTAQMVASLQKAVG